MPFDHKRRHPLYEAYERQADVLWRTYLGGEAYPAELFLDRYPREEKDLFEERKSREYLLNYVSTVVDSHIAPVFRRDPTRELPETFRPFEEDATGEGDSLTDFVREAMTFALAALRAYVVVDADEDGYPYCHMVHPANLLDYERDPKSGEYLWAVIAEEYVEAPSPFEARVDEKRYRVWTPEAWYLFDDNGEQLDEQSNQAGRVPLIEAVPGNMPLPMVDLARINKRIFNISSQIDEILCNVTFPQPYIQAGEEGVENVGANVSDGADVPDTTPIKMGTTRMFLLPDGATMPPGYLVPPDGPIQRQMEERERLIEAIYSLAGLERGSAEGSAPQSGVAKAYDFRETNARLGAVAQAAERLEFEILSLVQAYGFAGDFNVAYRKDYNVRDFRLVLEDYVTISETNLPPVVKKRSALELAGQIAEDADAETKQKIQQAVEDMPDSAFDTKSASPLDDILGPVRPNGAIADVSGRGDGNAPDGNQDNRR